MQTSLYAEDLSNSGFDLYDVGAIKDQSTLIDADWRRKTRPKRIRAKSAEEVRTEKLHNKKLKSLDDASFDTSSHHTIDYLVETRSNKTYTFGEGSRYPHLKRQRPVKRSLSAGNFNWNLLVSRIDNRFDLMAKNEAKKNTGDPLTKLRNVLGQSLLDRIRDEFPELYEHLMEHIKNKKQLSYAFCRDLLADYNINLEEERKQ